MTDIDRIYIRIPAETKKTAKRYDINLSDAARRGIEEEIERQKKIEAAGLGLKQNDNEK